MPSVPYCPTRVAADLVVSSCGYRDVRTDGHRLADTADGGCVADDQPIIGVGTGDRSSAFDKCRIASKCQPYTDVACIWVRCDRPIEREPVVDSELDASR